MSTRNAQTQDPISIHDLLRVAREIDAGAGQERQHIYPSDRVDIILTAARRFGITAGKCMTVDGDDLFGQLSPVTQDAVEDLGGLRHIDNPAIQISGYSRGRVRIKLTQKADYIVRAWRHDRLAPSAVAEVVEVSRKESDEEAVARYRQKVREKRGPGDGRTSYGPDAGKARSRRSMRSSVPPTKDYDDAEESVSDDGTDSGSATASASNGQPEDAAAAQDVRERLPRHKRISSTPPTKTGDAEEASAGSTAGEDIDAGSATASASNGQPAGTTAAQQGDGRHGGSASGDSDVSDSELRDEEQKKSGAQKKALGHMGSGLPGRNRKCRDNERRNSGSREDEGRSNQGSRGNDGNRNDETRDDDDHEGRSRKDEPRDSLRQRRKREAQVTANLDKPTGSGNARTGNDSQQESLDGRDGHADNAHTTTPDDLCKRQPGAIGEGLYSVLASSKSRTASADTGNTRSGSGVQILRLHSKSGSDGVGAGFDADSGVTPEIGVQILRLHSIEGVHILRLHGADDTEDSPDDTAENDDELTKEERIERILERSYLNTDMKVTAAQRRMIDDAVEGLDDGLQRPARGMIVHMLHTAEARTLGEWAPIHHQVLINKLPGGWVLAERHGGTKNVWAYDALPVESYKGGLYSSDHGKAREYRINPEWAVAFKRKGERGKATYDAVKGTRSSQAASTMKTILHDDSRHVWGKKRGDLPIGDSLLDGALRVLKDADHVLDTTALPKALKTYEEELEDVLEQYEGDTSDHADNKRKEAWGRVYSMRSGIETVERQTQHTGEDGITHIKNAYKVQEISGRVSFRRGGPQGLPKEIKAVAYDVEGLRNYDISSSQTIGLRQLARELQELGADVDSAPLDDYIDKGGKDWAAAEYGYDRSFIKPPEHSVKFNSMLPDSIKQAYKTRNHIGRLPAVAKHVQKYYRRRRAQNAVLRDLGEIFGDIKTMVEKMSDHLLTTYWDAHKVRGGRGKGWTMRNHAGVTFCPYDYDEGHQRRSKAMAWYLQGLEAAYVCAITVLSVEYDYEPIANEHDGLICKGEIPAEAMRRARELSGFREAQLVEKPFDDAEDVIAFCEKSDIDIPDHLNDHSTEDDSCTQKTTSNPTNCHKDAWSGAGSEAATASTTARPNTSGSAAGTGSTPNGRTTPPDTCSSPGSAPSTSKSSTPAGSGSRSPSGTTEKRRQKSRRSVTSGATTTSSTRGDGEDEREDAEGESRLRKHY